MVQHRGVRIHAGTYPWYSFPRADSGPLLAQSSELLLHCVLDKSHLKPMCQHDSDGSVSLEYVVNLIVLLEDQIPEVEKQRLWIT